MTEAGVNRRDLGTEVYNYNWAVTTTGKPLDSVLTDQVPETQAKNLQQVASSQQRERAATSIALVSLVKRPLFAWSVSWYTVHSPDDRRDRCSGDFGTYSFVFVSRREIRVGLRVAWNGMDRYLLGGGGSGISYRREGKFRLQLIGVHN